MEKLNELVDQAKFVADWHGSDWSSALCQNKDGKQAHEIICESRGEAVISTGSNSNEASWLCDYLELCSPANILAIAEAFRALEKQRDALAAENEALVHYIDGECYTESKRTGVYTCAGMNKPRSTATDAYLNSVRAEGIHFAANRILAAWKSCLIKATPAEAADVSGAVLSALEFLPKANPEEFKRDYADQVRADIAELLRAGKDGE